MASDDLREVRLAELCDSIDYGFTQSASETAVGPRFLRITDIVSGHVDWTSVPYCVADDLARKKYQLEDGDIVIARTGATTGASAYIREPPPSVFASYLVRLKVRTKADPRFVSYLLHSEPFWNYVRAVMGEKSAQPNASARTLTQATLLVPSLENQRAIASILGSLDDKIELNRRMNQTLEQIAQALFKSWFVDFDPVRAKADGRWKKGESLPGMPADMWDLWPNEFEESEIGEIPKGWEVVTLQDALSTLESGSRPTGGASEIHDGAVPSVGAENVLGLGHYDYTKTKYVPRGYYDSMARGKLLRGDVLLYKDGAQIGRRSYFDEGYPFDECCVNEHVFILRVRAPFTQRFLYFWLDQDWISDEVVSRNSGSAQPGLNQPAVLSLPILKPAERIVQSFDLRVAPLTTRIFRAELESRTLGETRDALLPKLLSGEIRISISEGSA